jgi:uncharacterized MAPEG superfamily protein
MTDFLKKYNLSILAIPAYYTLAFLPHAYAINVATNTKPLTWDNSAPRSPAAKAAIKEKISEEQYGRYERAEAASANAYENLPLFASAVIVANAAGLKRDGPFGLDAFIGAWFGARILHTLSYILITDPTTSFLRTGIWASSVGLCFGVFGQAARVLNRGLA